MNDRDFLKDSNTNWRYILIVSILAFLVAGGILSYQWWVEKREILIPKFSEVRKPEKVEEIIKPLILLEGALKLEEKFVEENERETAFLQEGDIWVLDKNLEKKYKMVDTQEAIIDFSFSADGKIIYWLNEKGELWRKKEGEPEIPLAGVPGKIEYEKYKGYVDKYKQDFLEICKKTLEPYEEYYEENVGKFYELGKIKNFKLSPNGEYIAYEPLAGYTSCCAGIFDVPVTSVWIMGRAGREKVEVEWPSEVWRPLIFFDGWFPDSKKILFHFSAADEATQGSPFYEVGIDGKNPKVYTEIFKFFKEGVEVEIEDIEVEDIEYLTMEVVGTDPVYSPSGEKVAYIKEWNQVRLKDVETKEIKTILELGEKEYLPFGPASKTLIWSEDGNLLLVRGINKVFVLNKEGEVISQTNFEAEEVENAVLSPDKKYVAGVYKMKGGGTEVIFFINLLTQEKKKFKLPEFKNYSGTVNIYPQFFSGNDRLYYLIKLKEEQSSYQLWVIDTNTWESYKVIEDVSQVVRVP